MRRRCARRLRGCAPVWRVQRIQLCLSLSLTFAAESVYVPSCFLSTAHRVESPAAASAGNAADCMCGVSGAGVCEVTSVSVCLAVSAQRMQLAQGGAEQRRSALLGLSEPHVPKRDVDATAHCAALPPPLCSTGTVHQRRVHLSTLHSTAAAH